MRESRNYTCREDSLGPRLESTRRGGRDDGVNSVSMSDLPTLPARPAHGHKGTFGTVYVLGGQAAGSAGGRVMIGGPAFAAMGALRVGTGLAVLALPRPTVAAALVLAPSATALALPVDQDKQLKPSDVAELLDEHLPLCDCLAIGPGLGAGVPQQQVVVRLTNQDEVPLVLDADALNCLASVREFQRDFRASAVLTPHPGEYMRLARALGITLDPTNEAQRQEAAAQLAQRLGCVVVLKGHRTVISDGIHTTVNQTGNVALATAGTGDVLTGMIAGMIAQHLKPLSLFECARLAVHLHGLAADRWADAHGHAGMTASDLLLEIPGAMRAFAHS